MAKNLNQVIERFSSSRGIGKRIEVLNYHFCYDRIIIQLSSFDENTNKETARIPIYFSFDEFYGLANRIMNQGLYYDIKRQQEKKRNNYPVTLKMGGTSPKQLAQQGKARNDGMGECRILSVNMGDKQDVILKAVSGPGKTGPKNQIEPAWKSDSEADKMISMGLSFMDFEALFAVGKAHIDSYLNSRYAENFYELDPVPEATKPRPFKPGRKDYGAAMSNPPQNPNYQSNSNMQYTNQNNYSQNQPVYNNSNNNYGGGYGQGQY